AKDDVLLTWSTASEVKVSRFEIERKKSESSEWEKVETVRANGNASSVSSYAFTDFFPFTTHNSLYYRLRIVDNDGSFEYSKVVSVNREQQVKQSLAVYPNPFSNHVNVEFVSLNDGIAN